MDIDRDDLDHKANVYQVQSSEVMKNGTKFCLGRPNIRADDVLFNIYSVTEENNVDAKIGTYTLSMEKYKEFGDISADGFDNLKAFTALGEPTLFQTVTVKADAAPTAKGKSFTAFSTKFDVVKVDGEGNSFFYAVHECLKTSDKFKKYHAESSDKFAQTVRNHAAPQVTAKDFVNAKEHYFLKMDHAAYVAAFNRVNEMKAKEDAVEGDIVFLDRWCYTHADGKFEELSEKGAKGYNHGMPFQPTWGLDTATDEEKQEEFVQEHLDVEDVVQHVEQFKLEKWSELQDFMKTKRYWADEMIMYHAADLLQVNFVVVEATDDKLEVLRCFHNHPDYVLLLRKGPTYSALLHKGDQKGVWTKAELPADISGSPCCASGKSEMVGKRVFVDTKEKAKKEESKLKKEDKDETDKLKVKEKEEKEEEDKDDKKEDKDEESKKEDKDEDDKKEDEESKTKKEDKDEESKTKKKDKDEKEAKPESKKVKADETEQDNEKKVKKVKKEDSRTRAGKPLAGTRKKNKL